MNDPVLVVKALNNCAKAPLYNFFAKYFSEAPLDYNMASQPTSAATFLDPVILRFKQTSQEVLLMLDVAHSPQNSIIKDEWMQHRRSHGHLSLILSVP